MKKPKFIPEFDDIPTPRAKMPEVALEERELNFVEVELGFPEDVALAEASRCLSCRRCIGCGLCLAECDRDAIVYDQEPTTTNASADAIVLAAGSTYFDASRKPELGYSSSLNVVTTVELERMLSPAGPYGGLPLRPGDGTLPRRVAFIQCVGSREEGIGADYCSSSCCTDSLVLASLLADRLETVDATVFHRGMRPLGRRGEELCRLAEKGDGPSLVLSAVGGVEGCDCTGPVTVTYDTGSGDETAEFDLVVLAVGRRVAGAARSAARRLRADTNKFGFVAAGSLAPADTSAEDVYTAGSCTRPAMPMDEVLSGAAAAAVATRGENGLGSGGEPAGSGNAPGSTSERTSGTTPGSESSTAPASTGPAVVCVCEQGLSVTGFAPGRLVREVGRLDDVTLAVSLKLACGPESLERLKDLTGNLAGARFLVVGCFPGTHGALLRERFAGRLGAKVGVGVVGVDPATDDASAVVEAVGNWIAGGESEVDPERLSERVQKALVVGGGLAGLAASLELAAHGVPVTLVESSDALGGPTPPVVALEEGGTDAWGAFAERADADPLVDVRLGSRLTGIEPAEGGFVPTLGGDDSGALEPHGVLIAATGAREHDPSIASGEGRVVTQSALAAAPAGETGRGRVVMVQCVGSRNEEHPYCSRTCCADALRNAIAMKREDPDADVAVLHRGIRVWGFDEELLSEAIELGVTFDEVEDTAKVTGGDSAGVRATRAGTGESIALEPDLVVLSTGVEPSDEAHGLAELLGVELAEDGFFVGSMGSAGALPGAEVDAFACGRACGPATIEERVLQAQAVAGKAYLLLKRGVR